MITLEDIKNIEKYNSSALKEGLRQAEQRIKFYSDVKESLEKKAFTLLSMFLAFSTAFFSVPKLLEAEQPGIYVASTITGVLFFIGTIFLFLSLRPEDYASLGQHPETWLKKDIIDGDNDNTDYVIATILHSYEASLAASDSSNTKKLKLLECGIVCGMIAPAPFFLYLLFLFMKAFFC